MVLYDRVNRTRRARIPLLTNFFRAEDQVTVRHLLMHRAGYQLTRLWRIAILRPRRALLCLRRRCNAFLVTVTSTPTWR